jgi:hypothetical protein
MKVKANDPATIKLAIQEKPLNIQSESQSSVEITLGSKGNVTYTVKAYADTAEEARRQAVQEFKKLQKEFKQ